PANDRSGSLPCSTQAIQTTVESNTSILKIAVVHYHLEPGGVTRVIENTFDAFEQSPERPNFVVLSGRPYFGQKIKDIAVVEGLD
ncbi:MAG: hypothetical protein O3B25_00785, partial [Verrucomicrobia bacterium]|nr:hypothetical protein [Verrucomicrobiota bacterium]